MKGVGLVGVDQAGLAAVPELAEPLGAGAELPALADLVTVDRFLDGSFDADAGTSRFRVRIVGVLPQGAAADRAGCWCSAGRGRRGCRGIAGSAARRWCSPIRAGRGRRRPRRAGRRAGR